MPRDARLFSSIALRLRSSAVRGAVPIQVPQGKGTPRPRIRAAAAMGTSRAGVSARRRTLLLPAMLLLSVARLVGGLAVGVTAARTASRRREAQTVSPD